MKNKKNIFYIVTCFLYNFTLWSDPIVTFFIRPYPVMPNRSYCQRISLNLKHPGVIAEHCLYGIIDPKLSSGILATYGGFLTVSDAHGQISFPYKHTKKTVTLLITPQITPVLMIGNTVHHLEVEDTKLATMFLIEQKQDEATSLPYWETQSIPLPENKQISTQAIIIIANPHDMYVPIGATPTTEGASLVLPDMYAKEGINHVSEALYMLNLKHLFGPVRYQYKAGPARNALLIS